MVAEDGEHVVVVKTERRGLTGEGCTGQTFEYTR